MDNKRLVLDLLERWKVDFPKRKATVERYLAEAGQTGAYDLAIDLPEKVTDLATFTTSTRQPLSPMLEARFEFCGTWKEGGTIWLGAREIELKTHSRPVLKTHRSLRKHWDGSASMIYRDDQLSLFGISEDLPENITYLVWIGQSEPEIWSYHGMESYKHHDFAAYLQWLIKGF